MINCPLVARFAIERIISLPCVVDKQSLENHMCLSQDINKLYLLPTITIKVSKGKKNNIHSMPLRQWVTTFLPFK